MKLKLFKTVGLLIALSFSTTIFSQAKQDVKQKISPDLLRNDFLFLRDTLQKIHPGIYRYISKATFNQITDSCYDSIRDSMTTTDFFTLTSFVIASIGDGHTNCKLSSDATKEIISTTKFFPAMVVFIHNKAFIYCCRQDSTLNASELLSINNQPTDKIVQKLFNYIPSDAFIQSHKNWELNDNFPLLYNALYGETNNYKITCKTRKGEIKTAVLQADAIKNFICPSPFSRPDKYLKLTYTSNNVAVLSIKTFFDGYLNQTGENFKAFLDSAFTDIRNKKITKLIIDIRGNQGGNDGNGELLYSYLTSKPFRYYLSQETVTTKFSSNNHPNLALQQPQKNNYSGKVFVLIDGRSFSASAEFSSIVKTNDRGKFIGEECGGGYYGNTSGDEDLVTLPATKITVRIPRVKYSMAVNSIGNNIYSIQPDFSVYQTIADFINRDDNQLNYAIKLVGNI